MIVEDLNLFFQSHCPKEIIPVLCIYFNYKEQDQQTPTNVVGSLLKQLILYDDEPCCSKELELKFDARKRSQPDEKELIDVFVKEIRYRFKR